MKFTVALLALVPAVFAALEPERQARPSKFRLWFSNKQKKYRPKKLQVVVVSLLFLVFVIQVPEPTTNSPDVMVPSRLVPPLAKMMPTVLVSTSWLIKTSVLFSDKNVTKPEQLLPLLQFKTSTWREKLLAVPQLSVLNSTLLSWLTVSPNPATWTSKSG